MLLSFNSSAHLCCGMQATSPADKQGWWRTPSGKSIPRRESTKQGLQATSVDSADDASQSDVASAMSMGDLPLAKSAYTPSSVAGSADAAWGPDAEEASDELMPLYSTSLRGPLPTVEEHFDEGLGMHQPQSLADLSKAGWTVDKALLQASAHANTHRMSRTCSFPDLGTRLQTVSSSTGGSPTFAGQPPYTAQQGVPDFSHRGPPVLNSFAPDVGQEFTAKPLSVLNPHAATFQPGSAASQPSSHGLLQPALKLQQFSEAQQQPILDVLSDHVKIPKLAVRLGVQEREHDNEPTADFGQQLSSRHKSLQPNSFAEAARQAERSVARRLLLRKRNSSFGKSKSCNDLVAVEPKSPTRSPFAPLANL